MDLLISNVTVDLISSVSTHHDLPSDHAAVKCLINIARPPASTKTLLIHKLRSTDMTSFKSDICNSSLMTDPAIDLDELVLQYDSVVKDVLDKHAPEVLKTVILRPHAPWYSDTLRAAKQVKRRRERKWIKSGLAVHHELYKEQCTIYRDLVNNSKSNYHRRQISECNQRSLFRVIHKLSSPKCLKKLQVLIILLISPTILLVSSKTKLRNCMADLIIYIHHPSPLTFMIIVFRHSPLFV